MKVVKRLLTNPTSLIGTLLLTAFATVAIIAPWAAPPPANARDPYMIPRDGFSTTPEDPSAEHRLGTTEGQYDIYYGVSGVRARLFALG